MSGLSTYNGPEIFNYASVLAGRLSAIPAWSDFAEAVNEVLDRNVDSPRRNLSRVRSSASYRKDEIISPRYSGGPVIDVKTGNNVPLLAGTYIPAARIVKIVYDEGTLSNPGQDYMTVEFGISGDRTVQWTFNISAPQERSLLIQNANMLGFDFFNTNFTDKDFQRINDFISIYWPVAGTPSYTNFMGFVKNIVIECAPLWTYDDPTTDNYPILESLPQGALTITQGGPWWLTSHVEMRYDPLQTSITDNEAVIDQTTLKDLVDLFYYFAPINLVLERIVAQVNLEVQFYVGTAAQELKIFFEKFNYYESQSGKVGPLLASGGQDTTVLMQNLVYQSPILNQQINLNVVLNYSAFEYVKDYYDYSDVNFNFNNVLVINSTEIQYSLFSYQPPVLSSTINFNSVICAAGMEYAKFITDYNSGGTYTNQTIVGSYQEIGFGYTAYSVNDLNTIITNICVSDFTQVFCGYVYGNTIYSGATENIQLENSVIDIGLQESVTYGFVDLNKSYPVLNRTTLNMLFVGSCSNIIFDNISDNGRYYGSFGGYGIISNNQSAFYAKVVAGLGTLP